MIHNKTKRYFSIAAYLLIGLLLQSTLFECVAQNKTALQPNKKIVKMMVKQKGLLCYWDFSGKTPFVSKGKYKYTLTTGNTPIEIKDEGPISGKSINISKGQYLYIPREKCPGLDIHGKNAQVTVLAWVKRQKGSPECEAIAGMWNESRKLRQYCLFVNIQLYNSADQVSGHVSGVGGPTPGNKYCVDVSIGRSKVNLGEWTLIGFTYDSHEAKSYYNGLFEPRESVNPYPYELGLFDGGKKGADFTVGAVDRSNEIGNFFAGQIGMLSVYDRALSAKEMAAIYQETKDCATVRSKR